MSAVVSWRRTPVSATEALLARATQRFLSWRQPSLREVSQPVPSFSSWRFWARTTAPPRCAQKSLCAEEVASTAAQLVSTKGGS